MAVVTEKLNFKLSSFLINLHLNSYMFFFLLLIQPFPEPPYHVHIGLNISSIKVVQKKKVHDKFVVKNPGKSSFV